MSFLKPKSKPSKKRISSVFDSRWKKLEKKGRCDGYGGEEYKRVKAEWFICQGYLLRKWEVPDASDLLSTFIRNRANLSPYSPTVLVNSVDDLRKGFTTPLTGKPVARKTPARKRQTKTKT